MGVSEIASLEMQSNEACIFCFSASLTLHRQVTFFFHLFKVPVTFQKSESLFILEKSDALWSYFSQMSERYISKQYQKSTGVQSIGKVDKSLNT